MRFLRRSLTGLFLLAVTLGLLVWAGQVITQALAVRLAGQEGAGPAEERVFVANVLTVAPQDLVPVLTSFGEVRSRRLLELRAPAGGRVVELAEGFADGSQVQAGQVLLRIDPADAEAARAVARSDLATAAAALTEAEPAIALARDELAAAEARVSLRQQALARQQNLLSRGAGTAAAVEAAELEASGAGQSVLAARSALAGAEAARGQAGTAEGRARIALSEAERALRNTELRAAFTGTLAEVSVVEGGVLTANERVGQIIDAGALEVSFRLPAAQYARLLDADGALITATITIALEVPGAEIETTGRVSRVSASVGAGQTGRLIYAQLDAARGFRPGDFVTVRVAEPALSGVAMLPAAAVDASSTVLALGPGDRLEQVAVAVLRRQGDRVIIVIGGLAGREVVAERSALLGAGIKVLPVRAQAGLAAGDAATAAAGADVVVLTPERRAALLAAVAANTGLQPEARARVLAALKLDLVPAAIVAGIEARMGG